MFKFSYRPSERIWDNSILTKRLARYRDILLGKRVARYLIAKKLAVEEFESSNLDNIWKTHEKARSKFRILLKEIDTDKIKIDDLKNPEISFLDLKAILADNMLKIVIFVKGDAE
jgi:uncharacterized Fe-S radical SAM superfamily protein PflX